MTIEMQETVIDGHTYRMTQLGATKGYKLFHRLVKALGPSIGHFVSAVVAKGDEASIRDVDITSDDFLQGIKSLTSGFSEHDLDHIVSELKSQTEVSVDDTNKMISLSPVFELHFRGRLGSMFRWLGWGLKVQFADFFDAFASMTLPSVGARSQAAKEKV